MENLNDSDLKKSSFGKSYERFVAQCSSLLHLTGQMKDLEARYRIEHRTRLQELENREKEVGVRELKAKSQEERFKYMDSMFQGLEIKEKRHEREAKEVEMKQIRFEAQVKTEQLEREEHFALQEKLIEERDKSVDAVEKSAQERKKQAESQLEQQMGRGEHLDSLEKLIQEREKHAKAVHKLLGERKKHLDSVSGRLQVKERQLEQQAKQIGLETPSAGDINHHQCGMNRDGGGLRLKRGESVGCQMSAPLNADEIVGLLGVISQHKQTLELYKTLDFADKIPDVIRIFIERKQVIEAIRFICTFKLTDKFPPVPLLNEYVEDSKKCWSETFHEEKTLDEKENAVDDHIANLRAVVRCVEDYCLESEYSVADIIQETLELGKLKENSNGKKRSSNTFAPMPRKKIICDLCC